MRNVTHAIQRGEKTPIAEFKLQSNNFRLLFSINDLDYLKRYRLIASCMAANIDQLFSLSRRFPSHTSQTPSLFPGANPDSAAKLVELLKLNHERYHIFMEGSAFHK